jgi:uncharacterized phage-like protein YoqJ
MTQNPPLVVCGTGHRTQVILSMTQKMVHEQEAKCEARLQELCEAALIQVQATKVISGLALGFDTALAEAAVKLKLPLVAAVPFEGQEAFWNDKQQKRYHELRKLAVEVVVVSDLSRTEASGKETAAAYHARDKWMVDNCDLVVALYCQEKKKKSGTGVTVRYAESINKTIKNLWSSFVKHGGIL